MQHISLVQQLRLDRSDDARRFIGWLAVLRSARLGRRRTAASALWLAVLALFSLPAVAQAAGSVYVANGGPAYQVSQYTIDPLTGALSPDTPPTVAADGGTVGVAVTPDGRSAYFTNGGGTVDQYDINAATGELSPKTPATVGAGAGPREIVVTPNGESAYVTNGSDNTVSQYDINPLTGVLTPKTPATVATGSGASPRGIAVTPDNRSAYVTNEDGTVSQYDINPLTGALSPKTPALVAAAYASEAIVVTPDGRSAYVSNTSGSVSQFDINQMTGALSPKTPASVPGGGGQGIVVTPDGKSAYVTVNGQVWSVSQYDINPVTGALSPKTPATVGAGNSPVSIAVSTDGKSAYVANEGDSTVSQYDINPATGVLAPKIPGTVAAGASASGIAVGSAPLSVQSTSTSLSCSPATVAVAQSTTCTATVTDTASAGQTPPTGTVSFASDSPGSFTGSPCTLSGTGATASCQITYAPTAYDTGTHTITATYSGDSIHAGHSGQTTVSISASRPTVAIVTPASGATYAQGQQLASSFSCTDVTGPGIKSCLDQNGLPSGSPVSTTSIGSHTFTVTATSNDGQTANQQVSYTVVAASADVSTSITGATTAADASTFTETMGVANAGPSPAIAVVSGLTVPQGVTITTTGGGNVVAGIVHWTDPSIAAGANVSHTVTFRVNQHTNRTVVIAAAAASLQVKDPNYANNAATITVNLGNGSSQTHSVTASTRWQLRRAFPPA